MQFDKRITVSGVVVTLRPYSEKRLRELTIINEEIKKFIDENPDTLIGEIADLRAEWYKRKAEVLWYSEQALPIEFFKDENFELSLLKESEDFFLKSAMYL